MENEKKGCGGCIVPILIAIGIIVALLIAIGAFSDGNSDFGSGSSRYVNSDYDSGSDGDSDMDVDDHDNTDSANSDGVNLTPEKYCYYYNSLSSKEKAVYDAALTAALNGENSVTVPAESGNIDIDGVNRVLAALTYDHPELYWLETIYYKNHIGKFKEFQLISYPFWDLSMNHDKYVSELENEADKVVALAKKNASDDYGRVKYVHDYLVETAEYDYDALNEYKKYGSANAPASCEYIFTAYGCLVNHRTVCAGYSKAFQLIMNRLGIPCTYVVGDAGESHAWNRVTIEGEEYYMDVTWDDAVVDKYSYTDYSYFNITTQELKQSRTIDDQFSQPVCSVNKYNYFVYNNYFVDQYSVAKVEEIAKKQKSQSVILIKFADSSGYNKAINDLRNGAMNNIVKECGLTAWLQHDDMLTLSLIK